MSFPFFFIVLVFVFGASIGLIVGNIIHDIEISKCKKANKKLRRKVRKLKAALALQNPPGAE